MGRIEQRTDALLLVGGFAGSEYLRQRVQVGLATNFSLVICLTSLEGTI